MKISTNLMILFTFCFIGNSFSNSFKNNIEQETIINNNSEPWFSLVPYKDSLCKNVGNGIGASLNWNIDKSTSADVPYFYPYTINDGVCLNISTNDQSTFNVIYKSYDCGIDGKYISNENFELSTCKYSNFLKGFYKFTKYEPLPEGTIILPIYMADYQPCDSWVPGFFNFIFNGTTINTLGASSSSTTSFYCNINNELPYQKSCKSSGNCSTKPLYNTCDKTDTFRFLCEGGPSYSSDSP